MNITSVLRLGCIWYEECPALLVADIRSVPSDFNISTVGRAPRAAQQPSGGAMSVRTSKCDLGDARWTRYRLHRHLENADQGRTDGDDHNDLKNTTRPARVRF